MSDFHDMTFTHLATEAIYVLLVLQSQVRIVLDSANGDNALLWRHESQLTNKSFCVGCRVPLQYPDRLCSASLLRPTISQ
jgi:hypothetical protein